MTRMAANATHPAVECTTVVRQNLEIPFVGAILRMPFGICLPNPMTDDGIDAGTYEQGDDEITAKSHDVPRRP